ncbi:MAG: hypothetical protein R3B97_00170 [Dehalococcoidia bacterium]|nr:hypothetical protein [Dehalococcoidia bacterium]MCB9485365.1 hypothetical protein [Thermoflexaceae bacterium]
MDEPLLLIADGNNLAWAGYHALRRSINPETPEQRVRTALLGLTGSALGLVVRAGEPPTPGSPAALARKNAGRVSGLTVAFDEGRPLFRRSIWPTYQTGRESDPQFMDNEVHIVEAIRQFSEMASMLPITIARGVNTEADDLMAFAALHAPPHVRIASTDRDFLQLVGERISIYSTVKRVVVNVDNFDEHVAPKASNGELVTFPPERYLDYRAASGDTSDDLPGIPGLGTIGAARLLQRAPLDDYLEHPMRAAGALGRANAKLEAALYSGEAAAIVARNRQLMDLRLAAGRFEHIDDVTWAGTWDEPAFRAWFKDQRISGLDLEATVIAMSALVG